MFLLLPLLLTTANIFNYADTAVMDYYDPDKGKKGSCDGSGDEFVQPGEKDTYVQLIISLALGLSAFIAFCVSAVEPNTGYLQLLDAETYSNRSCVHDGSHYTPPDTASLALK